MNHKIDIFVLIDKINGLGQAIVKGVAVRNQSNFKTTVTDGFLLDLRKYGQLFSRSIFAFVFLHWPNRESI